VAGGLQWVAPDFDEQFLEGFKFVFLVIQGFVIGCRHGNRRFVSCTNKGEGKMARMGVAGCFQQK